MDPIKLRLATENDYEEIWQIILYAKHTMLTNGRHQWTDQYPSPEIIRNDIATGHAYVLEERGSLAAFGVVVKNGEPEYEHLHDGRWLTTGDYYVVHRMAVAEKFRNKGYSRQFMTGVENIAAVHGICSIKVDTNHDNVEMLHLLPSMGYERCGRIEYKVSGTRIAFEKVISRTI